MIIMTTEMKVVLSQSIKLFSSCFQVVFKLFSSDEMFFFLWRMFFFLWRLVRPSQSGERAGPLARMLLGAKQRGRPRIVSRIIVEEYVAL